MGNLLKIVTIFLVVLLAAPRTGLAQESIAIPLILPLTGIGAFVGHEQQIAAKAVEAAVNKSGGINGRPLSFAIQDDASNPQVAVQLVQALRAQHVPLVLGPTWAASCGAVLPLDQADGPLTYCLSNSIQPPAGSYVFSAIFSTKDMLLASLRYFRAQGWKRIAYIVSSDATGQDAERAIEAALAAPDNGDIQVVAREHFTTTDLNVAAQMAQIKAAQPQALIAWAAGTPSVTLFRSEFDAGLNVPTLTSPANLNYAQLKRQSAFLPQVIIFPGSAAAAPSVATTREWRAALSAFNEAVTGPDVRPDQILAGTWDPLMLLVSALRKLGPTATAAQLRQYVAGTKRWAGVLGIYDFPAIPQRGLDASSVVIIRWDAAKSIWYAVSRPGGSPSRAS